tara:strand:+ start:422 stop:859 length:438 start_codon:yes stop_codon:yes gene_type:complete
MSDKKEPELHSQVTYDFTKTITGIEISPAYILGLQRITNLMITNNMDRGAELPRMFKKFETIVSEAKLPIEDQTKIELDAFEADIYTLFSLIQLLKYKAKEQNLELQTETTVTKAELAELTKMIEAGVDVTEKVKEMNAKMTIVR